MKTGEWAGIALGLVILITLVILFRTRSSGFETTPVDVVPTQTPPAPVTQQQQLPDVPSAPPVPEMQPGPVIQPTSNVMAMDDFPESMSFTTFKVASEIDTNDMPATDVPALPKTPDPTEDIEMKRTSTYTFPESMTFTSFKAESEFDEMPATSDMPKISGSTEDIEMTHSSMYSEWSP